MERVAQCRFLVGFKVCYIVFRTAGVKGFYASIDMPKLRSLAKSRGNIVVLDFM